jgi:SOS response regulatory protein OraA/RecX
MYATLVMKIYELAKKLGKPEIAKKHLEEGITKCKEKKFLETFSHYLEKL